jgi:outer membrane protein
MRTLATLALAAALALPLRAAAQAPKLGYFDLERAVSETDEGKAARAELKKDFDEKQKQLDARRVEFEKAQGDFEKQATILSDQARRERAGELERKARELGALFQQLQADLSKREGEAFGGIMSRMADIVREIAQADGFTMVFERTQGGIVYAPPANDLTNEVIRKYNSKFPLGSQKKPAAGGKPAAKPAAPAAAKPAAPAAPAAPAGGK